MHSAQAVVTSSRRPADNEIDLPPAAGRAPQPRRPIDDGRCLAVVLSLVGDVGLGAVPTPLHHTSSRTFAASAWPSVIGADSPSLRLRLIILQ